MAFKFSTGFRNAVLGTGSAKATLDGGKLQIYSGAVPATADAAAGATPLVVISDNGGAGGLSFEAAVSNATLLKLATQTWKGTIGTTGAPSFFRWVMSGDTGNESTTAVRIQGTVGTAGADMNLSNATLTATQEQVIDYFSISFPTA